MIILPATVGRVSLSYASDADLSVLAARIVGRPKAVIVGWHAVRLEAGFEHDLRVLGFVGGDAYITSPIIALDKVRRMTRTRSGNIYALKLRGDDDDMLSVLAHHLAHRLAGLDYVEAADVPQ